MNAWITNDHAWQMAGWTMIHFLWMGMLVAIGGGALRAACRRAAPPVRYAVSLTTFVALAALPAAIAAWVAGEPATVARLEMAEVVAVDSWRALPDAGEFVRNSQVATTSDRNIPLNDALSVAPFNPSPSPSSPRASRRGDLRGRGILDSLAWYLPWGWLAGSPLTFVWLALGVAGSQRLRRRSSPLVDGRAAEACARLRHALGVSRRVALAVCDQIAQPVLVGIVRPTILLPAAALTGWTPADLEMVLVHELAHVRRWDNLVNLGQRVVESLLFFHPAVWLVSRQVRRDREECCDAVVVAHTQAPQAYAALLVTTAAALRRGQAPPLAIASALVGHPLAARIRRILKLEDEPMQVSRTSLSLVVIALAAFVALRATLPTAADESANEAPVAAPIAAESATPADAPDSAPSPTTGVEAPVPVAPTPAQSYRAGFGDDVEPRLYPTENIRNVDFQGWTRLMTTPGIKVQMSPDGRAVAITASPDMHVQIEQFLGAAREETAEDSPRSRLLILQYQLFQLQKEQEELEVLKRVAQESPRGSAALEAAVQMEMGKDSTISQYQQSLFMLEQQIRQAQSPTRMQRLQAQRFQTFALLDQYRREAEKQIRERLMKLPNEGLRAAIAEYRIRAESIKQRKAEIEAKLKEAEAHVANATSTPSNDAPASEAMSSTNAPLPIGALPFLSLEDQRIADRAYRMLGVELEPLALDKTEEVKELGFAGGLLAVGANVAGIQGGDVLVGLHVWPITDFESLEAVLSRDDLGELAPLKYYVVRREPGLPGELHVVSGRLQVAGAGRPVAAPRRDVLLENPAPWPVAEPTLDVLQPAPTGWTNSPAPVVAPLPAGAAPTPTRNLRQPSPPGWPQPTAPGVAPMPAGPVPTTAYDSSPVADPPDAADGPFTSSAPQRTYEGKTVGHWRRSMATELSLERRAAAIQALAAFARIGDDAAVDALLDFAGEFDWSTRASRGSQDEEAKGNLVSLLSGTLARVPATHWLPALRKRIEADGDAWSPLAVRLLDRLCTTDDRVLAQLAELEKNGNAALSRAAAEARERAPQFVAHIMERDANGDGKVAADELPESVWGSLSQADQDGDGSVTSEELSTEIPTRDPNLLYTRITGDRLGPPPPRRSLTSR